VTIASISDYRALAWRRLPHFLFEYIDGGSHGEVTLQRNIANRGRPHVLGNVAPVKTRI